MIAYLYVLGASRDPDEVECSVPFEIDADEIFFGPCKKKLRQQLRKQYLEDRDSAEPTEDLYLVGFNGLGHERVRKIVWVGRIKLVMTFAHAWDALATERYDALRSNARGPSPLHLLPIRDNAGELLGYEHRSSLHPDDWVEDVAPRNSTKVRIEGERVMIAPGETAFSAFPRDCCLLLETSSRQRGLASHSMVKSWRCFEVRNRTSRTTWTRLRFSVAKTMAVSRESRARGSLSTEL